MTAPTEPRHARGCPHDDQVDALSLREPRRGRGRPATGRPRQRSAGITLPDADWDWLDALAAARGWSRSAAIAALVRAQRDGQSL